MLIFFTILIVIVAALILMSLFAPHKLPWYKPHLLLDTSEIQPIKEESLIEQPIITEGLGEADDFNIPLEENVAKLETILNEKNRIIEKLQRELAAEKSHRHEFEKVKLILDDEIKALRERNRELKLKIGDFK